MPIDLRELVAPAHTALLLQEVQRGVIGPDSKLPALAEAAAQLGIVPRIASLAQAARSAQVAVIHCTAEQLPGGFGMNHNAALFAGARRAGVELTREAALPLAEVGPEPGDLVLPRRHGLSPLSGTEHDALLRNQGVRTLVIVGVSLNIAIPNLVFDAVNRGYRAVLVRDAVAGIPVDYGPQLLEHSLRLVSTLVHSDDLLAAWC